MKIINNLTPEVCLSTYDNSGKCYSVDKKYKDIENICVAVIFGDTLIKISSKDLCECDFKEAINKHSEHLMSPAFWQIVGLVRKEVRDALEILNHEPLKLILTNSEYYSKYAWFYYGNYGNMYYGNKYLSRSVRPTKAFKI